MKISTRQLQGDEMLDALYVLNQYSLHPSPPFQNKDDWTAVVRERKGVTCYGPNRHLVWSEDNGDYPGAFTWALYPIDETDTRLVSRIRWNFHWPEPKLLFLDLFTEFTDHLAVREILQGVKGRVESHPDNFAANTVEFTVYLMLLLLPAFFGFSSFLDRLL